ncbi:cytochrome P450 [Modestobacter sp. Leaf380]|uniref:cytochrome P450 n=1 Tax=Modestobacter sp. Leaf380 TaxID=1736356 RepID=UPI0006FDA898|nr:cytochrome P450 [Modestobacter sp. Leaf380]KQS65700.1 hypothetical protein ASG41_13925 [Modestobacter sp. Leaf380]
MTVSPPTEDLFPWNDEAFRADPHPWYDRARQIAPVHRTGDGTFVVLGHGDTMHAARLPVMSIVEPGWAESHPWQIFNSTVLSLDPPLHTRMRRLTNRWLSPKSAAKWSATTSELTAAFLDALEPGQVVDAHFDIGVSPTHITMCRMLDMPEGDVERIFWALWDAMLINATAPGHEIAATSQAGLDYLFAETEQHLRAKQAEPGVGLADDLLAAHARGELTWREVLETTVILYMSGGPNPAYLIGSAIKLFAERPDIMQVYRDEPASRENIVNEVARLNPVELIITRFPTEDIDIHGVAVPAGSCVKFPIGAANRDPAVFSAPHEFDHTRSPDESRNLTFGLGVHSCAGQMLARAEVDAVLTEVAKRYSGIELVSSPTEVRTDRLVAFEHMPVRLLP